MEELIRDLENRYDGYLIFSNSTGVLQALNEQFFAEYYLLKHYLIFEPAETRFYQYAPQSGLWQYVSESWLIEQITQEVRDFLLSREIPDHLATYPFNLKRQMRKARFLSTAFKWSSRSLCEWRSGIQCTEFVMGNAALLAGGPFPESLGNRL